MNERFGAGYLKMFSALIIFIFLIPYSASVFKGLSHLFEANFHISYDVALLVMIGITGVYLIMGGYFAVTLTDFIQGLIMIVGAIAMVWLLTDKASEIANKPGFGGAIAAVDEGYTKHILKPAPWYALAGLVFMTSFGVWGMPQMVQKFYAVKNESVIVKAAVVTFLFSIIIAFAAYYSGALTHVFPGMPVLNQAGKPDFDRMVPELLTKYLPSGLMAVILLLVLSASMSTLASLVLVSASSIAIDLYKGHLNPNISKENSLAMMRFLSGVFVVVSYFTAKMAEQQYTVIVEMMSVSWGAVAGAFMAPFFYGLYWRRATRAGVWAGMVTGLVLNIALTYYLGKPLAPVAASIAMIVPFAVIPIVSLVTTPPSEALLAKAFAKPDGTAPAGAKPAAVAK